MNSNSNCATMILHTKNRPHFLIRALNYYNRKNCNAITEYIVADASEETQYQEFINYFKATDWNIKIKILRFPPSSSLAPRIQGALDCSESQYILLAADDDLFFLDWIEKAILFLNQDTSFGVVYGNTIRFGLEKYQPTGKLIKYKLSERDRVPQERWLEDEHFEDRLNMLGKSEWSTVGWYALQRRSLIELIVNYAIESNIEWECFEGLLTFCQAALTKTRKLNEIVLARQNEDNERVPSYYSDLEADIGKLQSVCTNIIIEQLGIPIQVGELLVNKAFEPVIESLKMNELYKWRRSLRIWLSRNKLLSRIIFLRRELLLKMSSETRDPRFPPVPTLSYDGPEILEILEAIKLNSLTALGNR